MYKQTFEQYSNAFLASTPEIAAEILDLSVKTPVWMADLYPIEKWTSNQNVMQQLVFRGSLPEVERGFDRWKQLANTAGCEPCTDDCSYNWTQFHGNAMDRRMVQLMRREFKTPAYCVNEIASTEEYEQVFSNLMSNIQSQVQFFKEMNIGLNFLTGIATKLVVDGSGIRGNRNDPYSYPPIGNAVLSKLNLTLLSKIYEGMRRRSDVKPFDTVNGRPIYAISASDEIMDNLYREDPGSREDLRFSSAVDALITRYNFISSVRGQFINAPILYPRRFNYINGAWFEILPYVNGIPAEVGTFSDINPAWEAAAYEEVLIYGAEPFKLFYRSPFTTIGAGTEFGPEPTFMDTWLWVNPQTDPDPFRRSGYFATSIQIALSAQWSGGVYGVLVPRPKASSVAQYYPADICPPTPVACDNVIPEQACPCPLILNMQYNPVAGTYTFSLAVPIVAEAEDTIQLGIGTGGYLVGTVVGVSTDGAFVDVTFPEGTVVTDCTVFTELFCNNGLSCSTLVSRVSDCRSAETNQFIAVVQNLVRAITPGQILTGFMGDGTMQSFEIVSVDQANNTYVLEYSAPSGATDGEAPAATDITCDRNGIVKLCVPPSTDAICPACVSPVLAPCEEPAPAAIDSTGTNDTLYTQGELFVFTVVYDTPVIASGPGVVVADWSGAGGDFDLSIIPNAVYSNTVSYAANVPAETGVLNILAQTFTGTIVDENGLAASKVLTVALQQGPFTVV